MAEESADGQEKTEEPSARKLEKGREDGRVVSSKEMFVFTSVASGLVLILCAIWFGPFAIQQWAKLFYAPPPISLDELIEQKLNLALKLGVLSISIIGVPLMAVTLATQFGVGGIVFSPKAMGFKGSKINPLAGLKRMFSMKSLVELGKSILKLVLLIGIATAALFAMAADFIKISDGTLAQGLEILRINLPALVGFLLLGLLIIAILDYSWQRYSFMQSMRMTKQEVKDEMKQTEGSPEVKSKIRQMQMQTMRQASQQAAALDDVADATAIITNPTHFAVAIKYDTSMTGAPIVLAMGKGAMALRVIERAEQENVTMFQSPLLARALYFTSRIGEEISEQLYTAVAVVLAYLYRLEKGETLNIPEVELPDGMKFDDNGKPMEV